MARPDLGTKRVCPTTGRKFYDLNRDPIVSPYTGEELPRASFEPVVAARGAARPRPREDEDEVEVVSAGPETVSLEEVGASEEEAAGAVEDEAGLVEEAGAEEEDTFLEEEEEGGDDVADLIDGEIEDDEES